MAEVSDLAKIIQLSVAPVFLLSGIGSILVVMTNRMSRIIDRSRVLDEKLAKSPDESEGIKEELTVLAQRARLISRAILLCTVTAIEICSVIVILFAGAFVPIDLTIPVALLFIGAMAAFIVGLISFLREILIAIATRRIGPF